MVDGSLKTFTVAGKRMLKFTPLIDVYPAASAMGQGIEELSFRLYPKDSHI